MVNSVINIASFEEGFALQKAVVDALAKQNFKIENFAAEENALDVVRMAIAAMALSIIGDAAVQKTLWSCLGRCLYNGERINAQTFESQDNRADFVPIAAKCIEVNMTPFIEGLLSAWKSIVPLVAENSPK